MIYFCTFQTLTYLLKLNTSKMSIDCLSLLHINKECCLHVVPNAFIPKVIIY